MPEQRIGRGNVELESTSKERVDNKHRVGSWTRVRRQKIRILILAQSPVNFVFLSLFVS